MIEMLVAIMLVSIIAVVLVTLEDRRSKKAR